MRVYRGFPALRGKEPFSEDLNTVQYHGMILLLFSMRSQGTSNPEHQNLSCFWEKNPKTCKHLYAQNDSSTESVGGNPSPSSSKAGTGAPCGPSARLTQLGAEVGDWHHSAPHTSATLAPHPCSHPSVSAGSQGLVPCPR